MTSFLFGREILAKRFGFGYFSQFAIAHAQKEPHCTSGLNIESKIKFSVPGFVQNLNLCQFGRVLNHFGHFSGHVQKRLVAVVVGVVVLSCCSCSCCS